MRSKNKHRLLALSWVVGFGSGFALAMGIYKQPPLPMSEQQARTQGYVMGYDDCSDGKASLFPGE